METVRQAAPRASVAEPRQEEWPAERRMRKYLPLGRERAGLGPSWVPPRRPSARGGGTGRKTPIVLRKQAGEGGHKDHEVCHCCHRDCS